MLDGLINAAPPAPLAGHSCHVLRNYCCVGYNCRSRPPLSPRARLCTPCMRCIMVLLGKYRLTHVLSLSRSALVKAEQIVSKI